MGTLIDELALSDALESGRVCVAWLDVYQKELYNGVLTHNAKMLLKPHISTYTDRCRHDMELQAAKNIIKDLGC